LMPVRRIASATRSLSSMIFVRMRAANQVRACCGGELRSAEKVPDTFSSDLVFSATGFRGPNPNATF
jgi:hypothetical protein